MKKTVGFLAVGATLALVVGCGTAATNNTASTGNSAGNTGNSAGGSAPQKQVTIGFVPGETTDPFFISMEVGAQQEAQKLGVKLVWQGASTYSPSAQTPYINAMVTKKVDALITCPTDATAMIPPIQAAVSAGIPVITADSTISKTSLLTARVTSNNQQGGAAAADYLAKAAGGKKGVVAVLDPAPGITTDAARVTGFAAEIKKYPNLTYVGVQYDNEQTTKASQLAQDLLLHYPNLVGIFGTDDTSASGAAEGIRSSGKLGSVKIVGYDAEPAEIQDLQSGLISALIAQKPMIEGQLAVQYAYDAVTGKKSDIQSFTQLNNIIITKANLAQNTQWEYKSSAN